MKSTVRLFKAIPIDVHKEGRLDKDLLEATLSKGFIFAPEVIGSYSKKELKDLISIVHSELTLSAGEMNASFHKSWKKVRDASIEQLFIEQILHYITTYGFEAMDIYNEDSVYIPTEKLEIPELDNEKISLVVIRGYTKGELTEKLISLLSSGIALAEDTRNDIVDVATFLEFDGVKVDLIKNKEVRIMMYDYLSVLPENPVEFLRYIIYNLTGETLIIKNKYLFDKLKAEDSRRAVKLLKKYEEEHGLERLAEIFHRFKPLWLAMRTCAAMNKYINRIRKLAKKHHRPMPEDFLNTITHKIQLSEGISLPVLEKELKRVNIFRKIRLAYALKYRTKDADSILYKVRNGKSYATEFDFDRPDMARHVLDIVKDYIGEDIKPKVKNKRIYIPEYINYALPTTEKQFTGNFPSGTSVSVPKDLIFGVHWNNVKGHRIDLDLSLISMDGSKYGWDGFYRDEDGDILFSGDITDAPGKKGAAELFYVKKNKVGNYIMFVNYFNFEEGVEVPFKIITAQTELKKLSRNYMVDPNDIVSVAPTKINRKQDILGLVSITRDECRFYFAQTSMGNSITSYGSERAEHSRKYLANFYCDTIDFKDILEKAGANITASQEKCDIDLSPEKLEKDTLIKLVSN
jgi:hypothetical protein